MRLSVDLSLDTVSVDTARAAGYPGRLDSLQTSHRSVTARRGGGGGRESARSRAGPVAGSVAVAGRRRRNMSPR